MGIRILKVVPKEKMRESEDGWLIQEPEIIEAEIESGLEAMQKVVGGYIQCVYVDKGIDLWVNEEGKLSTPPLPYNFALAYDNQLRDVVNGTAFFASHNEEGETLGLTDENIEEIKERLINHYQKAFLDTMVLPVLQM